MMMGGGGPNIAELFATTLYTGTGAGRNLVTGIDADLHWVKRREATGSHSLYDKLRGTTKELSTDSTSGETTVAAGVTAFLADGATLGTDADINASGGSYVHWGFKRAAKFFDVVTYSGNAAPRSISHNLGVAPGFVVVKRRTSGDQWCVYVPDGVNKYGYLNNANVFTNSVNGIVGADATSFQLSNASAVNGSGSDYVAYLFASDADPSGIIRCGVYAGTGASNPVSVGWQPQFLLTRSTSRSGEWSMYDAARGFGSAPRLYTYLNREEAAYNVTVSSSGFTVGGSNNGMNASGEEYFYMAIREP